MAQGYRRGEVKNAPLIYVFAMIRIQDIRSYARYMSDVQENLRDKLPNYYEQKSSDKNIQINQDGTVNTITNDRVNFYFSDLENKKGIMVKDDRIVLHSTSYTRFDDFRGFFEPIIEEVKRTMKIAYYKGSGIRYVDHVKPIGDVRINDIVCDERFLPKVFVDDQSGGANEQSQIELYNATKFGNLIVRGTYLKKQPPVHPSILNSYSVIGGDESVEETLVIDTDHVDYENNQKLKEFDVSKVFDHIDELHEVCHKVFEETVNIEALESANDN
ncbi:MULTISPECIES: TIGR04255 family protein [Marinobacter]|uniref:TIGR04255 family protein n=1 Tax=Marinobacter TaxID=2742 RepID=UPI002941DD8F|nr:TIGR04255 family protein [Marinobacter salarius]WOI20179.1 TIGR04255 family protein [Marinobacter salarius]